MNVRKIKETCIYVQDLERSKEFYQRLGLSFYAEVPGSHVFFHAGDSMLLCFLQDVSRGKLPDHNAKGQIHFAFEVNLEDYDKIRQELISKGIVIEHDQDWKTDVKSFYFRDPDGHLLEIVTPGLWN